MSKMLRMTDAEFAARQKRVAPHKLPEVVKTIAKPQKSRVCPTEHAEQVAVIQWCDAHPIAKHIFAIPNGSHKSPAMAAKFKREGLRSGVPDLFLPVPSCGLYGLFIEMKRQKGSVTSQAQRDWAATLLRNGYAVAICNGAESAIQQIKWYLLENA